MDRDKVSKEIAKIANGSGGMPSKERFKELLVRLEKEYDLLWEENQELKLKLQQSSKATSSQTSTNTKNVNTIILSNDSMGPPTATATVVPATISTAGIQPSTSSSKTSKSKSGNKKHSNTSSSSTLSSSTSTLQYSKSSSKSQSHQSKRDGSHKWIKVRDYIGHRDGIWEISTCPWDILAFATCSTDRTARIWSVDGSKIPIVYAAHTGTVNSVRFHPTERLICTGSGDKTIHIIKLPADRSSTGVLKSPIPFQGGNNNLSQQPSPSQPQPTSVSSTPTSSSQLPQPTSQTLNINQGNPHSPVLNRKDKIVKLWTPLLERQKNDENNNNTNIHPYQQQQLQDTVFESSNENLNYNDDHLDDLADDSDDSDTSDTDDQDDIVFNNRYDDYVNQNRTVSQHAPPQHPSPIIERDLIEEFEITQQPTIQLPPPQSISSYHLTSQQLLPPQQQQHLQVPPPQSSSYINNNNNNNNIEPSYSILRQPLLELKGHSGPISAVTWASNTMVVSVSWDNTIRWWNSENGRSLSTVNNVCQERNHKLTNITSQPFSNTNVITSSTDGIIRIWDSRSSPNNTCIDTIHGHQDAVNSAIFTYDANNIISGGDDRVTKVWDVRQTKNSKVSIRCPLAINRLSVNQNSIIAIPQDDGRISVYDIYGNRKGKMKDQYKNGHKLMATSTAWSTDNSVIFSSSFDRKIVSWATE